MTQLVGRTCVVCNEKITSVLSAEFCEQCGNSVHRACREQFQPPAGLPATHCAQCGGQPETAPVKTAPPKPFSVVPLIVALMVAVVLLLAYVAWPLLMPKGTVASSPQQAEETSPAAPADTGDNPVVAIETTMGTIRARLFQDKAPKTVENFLDLVRQEFYDGIIFHRVIDGFMIQTGDPLGQGTGGRTDKGLPPKQLADEFHPELRHDRAGILSMANSGPNTGDTQFFITTVPTPWLDDKHAIFGEVLEGMDVVQQIEKVPTGANDRPRDEVKIQTIRLAEDEVVGG